jgi:hypothetical protein
MTLLAWRTVTAVMSFCRYSTTPYNWLCRWLKAQEGNDQPLAASKNP